ncbi:MAG: WbqC family protein [Bacteroidota bacterium]
MQLTILSYIFIKMSNESIPSTAFIFSLHYLPTIEYFQCISLSQPLILDIHEHYEKKSYRNRCRILSAQKVLDLSIPVIHSGQKQGMKEVKIDHHQRWARAHWHALASAYGKAPFFLYFEPELKKIYEQSYTYLIDFNLALLSFCLNILQWHPDIKFSEKYIEEPNPEKDLRKLIHPKVESGFDRLFGTPSYIQVFGKGFVRNLSIIDIIFCEGPNASLKIKETIAQARVTSNAKNVLS